VRHEDVRQDTEHSFVTSGFDAFNGRKYGVHCTNLRRYECHSLITRGKEPVTDRGLEAGCLLRKI
jgi:hypothetical protein